MRRSPFHAKSAPSLATMRAQSIPRSNLLVRAFGFVVSADPADAAPATPFAATFW
jgi:hypothetical protein